MATTASWITAAEAARLLRVNRATLYAYVSRGYIRSQATPGPSRARHYSRADVERLRQRAEERRDPDKAAARALTWGLPILESSITLIDGRRLYYRGHDAVALSRSHSVAAVASLVWTGAFATAFPPAPRQLSKTSGPFVVRAQRLLAAASVHDPLAFDLRPASVAMTGWRIVNALAHSAAPSRDGGGTVDARLARAWHVGARGADVLRAAIILCADHELNVSSFTARCVASAGSHPYAVVIAGLAALEGTRHGGASARVEAMLDAMRRARPPRTAVAARLRRGDTLEGFGHPLYKEGDPRAQALFDLLREHYDGSAELAFITSVADAAADALGERPNVDFALAAAARVLRLPPGAPLALFAIGRAIGWIGHALEQYASGQLIRPRARYVGVAPAIS